MIFVNNLQYLKIEPLFTKASRNITVIISSRLIGITLTAQDIYLSTKLIILYRYAAYNYYLQ